MNYVEYEAQSTLHHQQNKIKHQANFFRQAGLLILTLCGFTICVNQTKPANADDGDCNMDTSANAVTFHQRQESAKIKLPQERNRYHSDSEGQRKKLLAGTKNGSIYLDNDYHDKTRLHVHSENKSLRDTWQSKPVITWTRYQFVLNDRWRMSADLPNLQNFANGDGHGSLVPIPRLTYDFGNVKISSLYIPKIPDYNLIAVMGLYLTITF
jgi:hypothetical protein